MQYVCYVNPKHNELIFQGNFNANELPNPQTDISQDYNGL